MAYLILLADVACFAYTMGSAYSDLQEATPFCYVGPKAEIDIRKHIAPVPPYGPFDIFTVGIPMLVKNAL